MATITKRALAERIAKQTGHTQVVAKQIVQLFLDEIVQELARGNKLEFRDFGILEVVTRRSRNGRNPRTGAKVFVPAKRVVSFKMGRRMKKVVTFGEVADTSPKEDRPAGPLTDDDAPGQSAATSTSTPESPSSTPPVSAGPQEPTDSPEGTNSS